MKRVFLSLFAVMVLFVGIAVAHAEGEDTEATAGETAVKGDTGVEVCDGYVNNYATCLASVPEVSRSGLENALKSAVEGWKTAIKSSPEAKATVENGCRQALAAAKTAMQAYNCTWGE